MAAPFSAPSMQTSSAEAAPASREGRPGRRRHRMTDSTRNTERTLSPVDVALRVGIVGLALATGYIHSTLGGLLFTLNAVGYLVAAVAMVIPLSLAVRYRWLVRLGLM